MDLIKFKVNGEERTVGSNVSSDVMLVDYLRNYLQLRGTKYMCREGGCGACIVTAAKRPGAPHVAVNSCLVSVTSCHGWDIRTIEGLGNRKDGYHPLQTTLAEHHGTQCGYCTPGWIMSMHGIMESNKDLTMLEIEKSFASNLCRCTGYRPIMKSFKMFAKDAPPEDKIMDIENMSICNKGGKCCKSAYEDEDDWCVVRSSDVNDDKLIKIVLKDGKIWYRPRKLTEVLSLMKKHSESYMLVAGNTAKGVSPIDDYPDALIDISCIEEFRANEFDQNLIIGAGLTLNEFMSTLKTGAEQDYFSYLTKLYEHMDFVGNIPLRNVATIAGNLMIKHMKNEFQSDIYLLLDTVGAQLTILDSHGKKEVVTMEHFLKISMKGKVILNAMLPPLTDEYKLFTYKLMPRAQNAHAVINCGFLFKLNQSNIVQEARMVYGALSVNFRRAQATERYLVGKNLFSNDTLQGALRVLDGEMIVDHHPPEPSVEYRRYLAKSVLFKGLLTLCPSRASRFQSGTINLRKTRPCSSGKQTYSTDTSLWPLNQPIPKLEATIQCAGEAEYTDDIPSFHNEVFGAFVLSNVARGTIIKMDASEAMKLPGVIAFYTAKDIPGLNSFTPSDGAFTTVNEEVLCEGTVRYHGQPIAIIVAESQYLANRGAKLVKVKYSNITKPVTDIRVAKNDSTRNTTYKTIDATNTGSDIYKTITGTNVTLGQYHFPMETMACVAKRTEDGLEVHMSSQWLDGPQIMMARALNLDVNKVEVHVRRIGGSYGLKITRSVQPAVACAVVAYKLNRPCRFMTPLTTNLRAFGKRTPTVNDYEVAVNSSGVIQYINTNLYIDNGHVINDPVAFYANDIYFNCYDATKFNYISINTVTDTPKNSFCRGPGTFEGVAHIEHIMERISYEMSLDPIEVRLANTDKEFINNMTELLNTLKTSAQYTSRKAAVDSFNTQNRWMKRGLRWSFLRWPTVDGMYADVNLDVYHADGSVIITHSGIEMGQGINTKIAQVAAHLLKIPLSYIQIKSNNTITSPNTYVTGGSISTESIIVAIKRCVEQLETRLEPIKATLSDPTWQQVITAAYAANVDLQFHGFTGRTDGKPYNIYGMALCEVEVDVLTGEFEILRLDILQDVGLSISPEIDIGQIEGGFMMGLGHWTCEKIVYDSETGAMLTDRSWDYHIPVARDIPEDMRISFVKNSYSNDRILGSKGVGEPTICMSVVLPFALRAAIVQARQESGIATTKWFDIAGPYSVQNVCMAMETKTEDFKFS